MNSSNPLHPLISLITAYFFTLSRVLYLNEFRQSIGDFQLIMLLKLQIAFWKTQLRRDVAIAATIALLTSHAKWNSCLEESEHFTQFARFQ